MEKTLDRLILALDAKGYKKHGRATQLSKVIGYSVGMVSDVLRGKVELSDRFLDAVCTKVGLSKDWIETGKGEMFTGPEQGESRVTEKAPAYEKPFPEPIQKAIEVLEKNPERAWELYALILERVDKKK